MHPTLKKDLIPIGRVLIPGLLRVCHLFPPGAALLDVGANTSRVSCTSFRVSVPTL
jgi:hypothetical protein